MAENDNTPLPPRRARLVPIVGFVGEGGAVTITHPTWRPSPAGAPGPQRRRAETDGDR